jgi:membrane-bound serine protease (ClpP class)
LIEQVDGKEIETVWGKKTLALKGVPIENLDMGWRYRLLDVLSNPNIAYILMMLGFYGLFFELSNPGVIFPGVFGAICLILAFFAMQTLPVNYAGVLLILLAIVLFIAEIKVTSYGILSLGGVVSLLLGSLMLIESPDPALRISWLVIIPVVATTAAFFLFAMSFALRAQMRQPATGREGLVGRRAKVVSPIKPAGKVFVHGEYWNAESEDELEPGDTAEIVSVSELTLQVKKVSK